MGLSKLLFCGDQLRPDRADPRRFRRFQTGLAGQINIATS